MSKLSREQIASVEGQSSREAAITLGVGKTSINKYRKKYRDDDFKTFGDDNLLIGKETDAETFHEIWNGNEGVITVVLHEKITDEAILRKFGHDPETTHIVGVLEETHWQYNGVDWNHRYKFKTTRTEESYAADLPNLLAAAQKAATFSAPRNSLNRAIHVNWADAQTGKFDHRGGTPQLVERVYRVRDELERYMDRWNPTISRFMDGGDAIENFQNTPGQMGTNDLSLMDQIDLEATMEFDMIKTLAERTREVGVKGIGSNHCRWREGKGQLGTPADDWGLFIKKQLAKQFGMSKDYDHVNFQAPDQFSEHVMFDSYGINTIMYHGHQMGSLKGLDNFLLKMFMGGEAALSDIISLSHFHNFYQRGAGRHPISGHERVVLGNPTLDNGSSWFKNMAGSDSEPGLLVYVVDERGLDQESLTILR